MHRNNRTTYTEADEMFDFLWPGELEKDEDYQKCADENSTLDEKWNFVRKNMTNKLIDHKVLTEIYELTDQDMRLLCRLWKAYLYKLYSSFGTRRDDLGIMLNTILDVIHSPNCPTTFNELYDKILNVVFFTDDDECSDSESETLDTDHSSLFRRQMTTPEGFTTLQKKTDMESSIEKVLDHMYRRMDYDKVLDEMKSIPAFTNTKFLEDIDRVIVKKMNEFKKGDAFLKEYSKPSPWVSINTE